MVPQITCLSLLGVPFRHHIIDSSVFIREFFYFEARAADSIYSLPNLTLPGRFDVITQSVQAGATGVALVVLVTRQSDGEPFDLSGATALTIRIGFPDGTSIDHAAQLLTDGTDGKMFYVAQAGDLDEVGVNTLQGFATGSWGYVPSAVVPFEIYDNIATPA